MLGGKKFVKLNRLVYVPKPSLSFKPSFHFWFRFFKNSFRKYQWRFVLVIIILGLTIFAIKNITPRLPIFRHELIIGVVGEYTSLNLPQSLSQLYSAGLAKFDKTGQIIPDLASWETSDGKKFKFILKDNLFWQDGEKLTIDDIQFQLPNVEVQVLDEKSLEFILQDIFSPFPQVLTKPIFRRTSQIGTGPYRLAKIDKNGETFRKIDLVPVEKDLPKLKIRFFANTQSATAAFKTGQISVLFNLIRPNGLENWKGTDVIQIVDPTRLVAVFYNTKNDLLKEVKIRKALDISIDRSKFKNPTLVPYPPTSWVAQSYEVVYDMKKAAKLLQDANLASGKIEILAPAIFEALAEDLAKNWQRLGFEVKITKIDKIPENFQLAIFGLEIPFDPDQYSLWHSTQSHSLTGIENPKIDKLLEDGRKITDVNGRKRVYLDLQRELREQVPASFLFFQDRYVVINKNSEKKLAQIRKLFPEFPVN